jgi:hypothetical protein
VRQSFNISGPYFGLIEAVVQKTQYSLKEYKLHFFLLKLLNGNISKKLLFQAVGSGERCGEYSKGLGLDIDGSQFKVQYLAHRRFENIFTVLLT